MSEFAGYGFAVGTVVGLRSFSVDHLGRLTGVSILQVWLPGDNESACKKPSDGGYYSTALQTLYGQLWPSFTLRYATAPSPGVEVTGYPQEQLKVDPKPVVTPPHELATCSCGFYAYFGDSNDYGSRTTLTGVVEAFGKVTIGTRGFRAEKARIVALVIPTKRRDNRPDRIKGTDLKPHRLDRVRRNYPGIAVFDTQAAMAREYPTSDESITPETDAEFWTREAKV